MTIRGMSTYLLKRSSPLHLFFWAILPYLISLFIHFIFLIHANFASWNIGQKHTVRKDIQKSIKIDIKKVDVLQHHRGETHLIPEVEFRPGGKGGGTGGVPGVVMGGNTLDIIGVEADTVGGKGLKLRVNPSLGTGGGAWGGIGSGIGSGRSLHAGPERTIESFSKYIQALREAGIDVVFVFDATSSMSRTLREVKRKIGNLALALRKLVPSCRIGLVAYRDREDEDVIKTHPLAYGISSMQDFLNDLDAEGGYDIREAVDEGLKVAVERMKWNKKAKKCILLIGDAPPHKGDMPKAIETAKKFREQMGGTLSAIDTRVPERITQELWRSTVLPHITDPEIESFSFLTDPISVMDDFQTLAEVGGGESARLINEEKVVKNMFLFIFGSKWEVYLNEVMKNL